VQQWLKAMHKKERSNICPVAMFVYAQHGHELMGCKSPVGEPTLFIHSTMITTSRRQGQARESLSEGSLSAKLRADEQKSHIRPSFRGEWAQDHKTHRFEKYGKCGSCAVTVHVLIWGDLLNQRSVLPVRLWSINALACRTSSVDTNEPMNPIAQTGAILFVIKQKSAEGIVVGGHWI